MKIQSKAIWDSEYTHPKVIAKTYEPSADFKLFLKWLKKNQKYDLYKKGHYFLDAGCGIGKHALYVADTYDIQAEGYDISDIAIKEARKESIRRNLQEKILFSVKDSANILPNTKPPVYTIICDSMALHLYDTATRKKCIAYYADSLKEKGYLYLKTFAREGDSNAKFLIDQSRSKNLEEGSYTHPILSTIEHIYTKDELSALLAPYFTTLYFEKTSGYQKYKNISFKRMYYVVYAQKK